LFPQPKLPVTAFQIRVPRATIDRILNRLRGFASFPCEMPLFNPPRVVLERGYNLVHYSRLPKGGHFACLEQPQLFVEDVRQFFRKVRA
jgi:pimeloyl-ACP methyl ester carboxylesterase